MDKAKVCEALAEWPEDKQGTGQLFNPTTGCYCALGWLGHVGGMSDSEMIGGYEDDGYSSYLSGGPPDAYKRIYNLYDLAEEEGSAIWAANDEFRARNFPTPKESVRSKVGCE
jgi:hypothetical protein